MTIAIFLIRLLEVMFFTGLAGCAVVVLVSWISIFKSGFSNEDKTKNGMPPGGGGWAPPPERSYLFINPEFREQPVPGRTVSHSNGPFVSG